MTDASIIRIARDALTADELAVWLAKHVSQLGRRSGSLALGITEDAWRYRLRNAEQKIATALRQEAA